MFKTFTLHKNFESNPVVLFLCLGHSSTSLRFVPRFFFVHGEFSQPIAQMIFSSKPVQMPGKSVPPNHQEVIQTLIISEDCVLFSL